MDTGLNIEQLAAENARLYQEEQERRRELQTLLDITSAANSSLDLDEMLETTLDRLVNLVGASRAGVLLVDKQTGKLEARMIRPQRNVSPEDMDEITNASRAILASGELAYFEPDPHAPAGPLTRTSKSRGYL